MLALRTSCVLVDIVASIEPRKKEKNKGGGSLSQIEISTDNSTVLGRFSVLNGDKI